jgi:quinol monooxygenase YgiN
MSKPVSVSIEGCTTTLVYEDGEQSVQHHQTEEAAQAYVQSAEELIAGGVSE